MQFANCAIIRVRLAQTEILLINVQAAIPVNLEKINLIPPANHVLVEPDIMISLNSLCAACVITHAKNAVMEIRAMIASNVIP